MVQKVTFYIGANNETGADNIDKVANTLSGDFKGFTLIPCIGYFEGKRESSVMAVVFTDYTYSQITDVARNLCISCEQDCIVVELGYGDAYLVTIKGKVAPFEF